MQIDKAKGLKETLLEVCEWFGLSVTYFDARTVLQRRTGPDEFEIRIRCDDPIVKPKE